MNTFKVHRIPVILIKKISLILRNINKRINQLRAIMMKKVMKYNLKMKQMIKIKMRK